MTTQPHHPTIFRDAAANDLLRSANIDPMDAALLVVNLTRKSKERNLKDFSKINKLYQLGEAAYKEQRGSITFAKAVELTLQVKQHKRPRTLQDLRTITNRLFRFFPKLKRRKMRAIKSKELQKYLEQAFSTPRQFVKARMMLSGIFSVAVKHGYAESNPISRIPAPIVKEKEVHVLNIHQVESLHAAAIKPEHLACRAAMAIMLYAGIRPKEVERLIWADICLEDRVIYIRAEHSKTGGTRHVTIQKPLYRILQEAMPANPTQKICPPNWIIRWRRLRKDAGWSPQTTPWQQDCLRHTFATYHIKQFRNFNTLQYEMGHRSSDLLRTRYINLGTITQTHAHHFWRHALRSNEKLKMKN